MRIGRIQSGSAAWKPEAEPLFPQERRPCRRRRGYEAYLESRLRERRLAQFEHWNEIQVRLQHQWAPDPVIRWHQERYPGDPCPPKTTLFRYVRSKPSSWFLSRLVLAESGTKTVRYQLVAERQSEMIEAMFMRLALALKLEREMNGLLHPEIRKSFSELNRMLMDHFRVLQEMGLEPKHESMAPAAGGASESGTTQERLA
jgi:hypothetical protein